MVSLCLDLIHFSILRRMLMILMFNYQKWSALDVDNSGEIDFVEFTVFLSSCGSEFEQVQKEQATMTKEEKLKHASKRLSAKALNVDAYTSGR